MPSLVDRMKQRKIGQWALAYVAGAWVLFEVSDAVGGRWGLPDVIYQVLFVLLVIGFFATLILAWYHGEQGRQRVSGPELLMLTTLFVIAGGVLSFLGPATPGGQATDLSPASLSSSTDDAMPSIAVLPFASRSGLEEDRYFTDGMHDEILTRLSSVRGLKTISRTSVEEYRGGAKSIPEIGVELGVAVRLERDGDVEGYARAGGATSRLWSAYLTRNWEEANAVLEQGESLFLGASPTRYAVRSLRKAWVSRASGDEGSAEAHPRDAVAALEDLATERLVDQGAYRVLALAYATLGMEEKADAAMGRALEILPLERDAMHASFARRDMVRLNVFLGRYERAVDLVETLLSEPGGAVVRALGPRSDLRLAARQSAVPGFAGEVWNHVLTHEIP